jgi:hypothetical protein
MRGRVLPAEALPLDDEEAGPGVMETIKSLFAGKVLMPALRC